ncbi:hypothetical protein [Sinorhizobium medicae]|uniref:hypothetical protein n=1 Tax=Sinorhizobium medicae TaxID=110321 RepID=UPI0013E3409A|nr:hypothetical protein [Sinorhizobium medicae]
MHYRFVEVEGEEDDLDRVANEWRAKGYQLFQAVYKTTYRWVLIFEREPDRARIISSQQKGKQHAQLSIFVRPV